MPRTHRPAALLLSLGLALTGLTACAEEEPEPKFADEPTAAATPVEKKETAKEFIRRWNDEQARMQKGDTTEYRKIAGECEPCMAAADKVDEYYAAGGYVQTEGRQLLSIKRSNSLVGVKHLYLAKVESAPTEYRTHSQAPVETFDGGVAVFELQLDRQGNQWKLVNMVQVPS